jgi:hypothetical protein
VSDSSPLAGEFSLLCSVAFFTTNASNTLFLKPGQQELGKTEPRSEDSNKVNFKDTGVKCGLHCVGSGHGQ